MSEIEKRFLENDTIFLPLVSKEILQEKLSSAIKRANQHRQHELCEIEKIKTKALTYHDIHIQYLSYLLAKIGINLIIIEDEYIDRNFLKDFISYQIYCYGHYKKTCMRLHFFKVEDERIRSDILNKNFFSKSDEKSFKKIYFGNCVIRPLPKTFLGKISIKPFSVIPKSEGSQNNTKFIKRKFSSHFLGLTYVYSSIPIMGQDSSFGVCSSVSLWTTLQIISEIWEIGSVPSLSEITKTANSIHGNNRIIPSPGLSLKEMIYLLKQLNLSFQTHSNLYLTKFYKINFPYFLSSYLYSTIPIIMIIQWINQVDNFDEKYQNIGELNDKIKKYSNNLTSDRSSTSIEKKEIYISLKENLSLIVEKIKETFQNLTLIKKFDNIRRMNEYNKIIQEKINWINNVGNSIKKLISKNVDNYQQNELFQEYEKLFEEFFSYLSNAELFKFTNEKIESHTIVLTGYEEHNCFEPSNFFYNTHEYFFINDDLIGPYIPVRIENKNIEFSNGIYRSPCVEYCNISSEFDIIENFPSKPQQNNLLTARIKDILIPLHEDIKISYKDASRILNKFLTVFRYISDFFNIPIIQNYYKKNIFGQNGNFNNLLTFFSKFLENNWKIYHCTTNQYKKEIRKEIGHFNNYKKILLERLPRFLWIIKCFNKSDLIMEILIDGFEIVNVDYFLKFLIHNEEKEQIGEVLNQFLKNLLLFFNYERGILNDEIENALEKYPDNFNQIHIIFKDLVAEWGKEFDSLKKYPWQEIIQFIKLMKENLDDDI